MRWIYILVVFVMGLASRWGGRFGFLGGVDCLFFLVCGEGLGIYWFGYNKKIYIKYNCKDIFFFIDLIFY